MNTETKRHIDSARQVLVGVVPNPTSQIDQITNALIYKFMDDMDQAAIKVGGDPNFFIGNLEKYAWTRLMDSRMGNQERMNLYQEALLKFSESKQLPELFRGIFKSAFLPYRSPETLGMFLKEINYFDYSHPEELGNAYEYLLSIMSSQGDAGQFRTPRHIIDFMVEVVNPTMNDKVLDPACGTAGFLISAYKHILAQHDGLDDPNKKEKPLTPDQRKNLFNNFEGYDIDPGMVRIAEVNMYLHQFKNPKIFQYDTLSMEERWNDKFDVIMANPPFMSPKGGIKPHTKFSIQSSRSEVLFVDYIINHLRPKGRAGVIVPEGIIFQSGIAYKELRKNLVENGLFAVVSLPSGVFQPYSGVKTSILLFDNEISKQSSEVLFVKITNDGFDLGAQRRANNKTDLTEALDILNKWKNGIKSETKLVNYVDRSLITKSGDYNLSGDRYRIATDYSKVKWPMVKIEEVCEIGDGNHSSNYPKSSEMISSGVPFIRGVNLVDGTVLNIDIKYISKEKHEQLKKGHLKTGDVLFTNRGEIGKTAIIPAQFDNSNLNSQIAWLRPNNTLLSRYLFSVLNSPIIQENLPNEGATLKQFTIKQLRSLKIPLPPIEIQKQIIDELNGYQKIVDGAKQITTNWKPKIDIDPKWEKVKLDEVCEVTSSKRIYQDDYVTSGIPFYRTKEIVELSKGKEISLELYITEKKFNEIKNRFSVPQKGDILISAVGTIGITWLVSDDRQFYFKDGNLLWLKNFQNVDNKYIKLILDITVANNLHQLTNGAAYNALTIIKLKELEVPVPPIEIQLQIVKGIEFERGLVDYAKKLIEIYEEKIKKKIGEVWGEK